MLTNIDRLDIETALVAIFKSVSYGLVDPRKNNIIMANCFHAYCSHRLRRLVGERDWEPFTGGWTKTCLTLRPLVCLQNSFDPVLLKSDCSWHPPPPPHPYSISERDNEICTQVTRVSSGQDSCSHYSAWYETQQLLPQQNHSWPFYSTNRLMR